MSPADTPARPSPVLPANAPPTTKTRVLFLSTGNSVRTQMAEALLRHYASDRFEAFSAGLQPGGVIEPYTRRVMEEIGIDLEGQHPRHVRQYMGWIYFGYCVVLCSVAEERCPTTFPCVGEILYWPFEDPAAVVDGDVEMLTKFREVRDEIERRLREWLTSPSSQAAARSLWFTGA
jgi:arsenate reductase